MVFQPAVSETFNMGKVTQATCSFGGVSAKQKKASYI